MIPACLLQTKLFISAVKKNCFHGESAEKNSFVGKLVRSIFWFKYYSMPVCMRTAFQEELMGGTIGVDWAKGYNEQWDNPGNSSYRVGSLSFFEAWPHLALLNDKLKIENDAITVIQLGASSGREIAWLARENPQHKFIYTDIFDDVVNYAKQSICVDNLDFCTASADNLHVIAQFVETNQVLIFSSGSAQYVYPEHLDLMFKRVILSLKGKKAEFFIGEPAQDACTPLQLKGSSPRGNFSYSHDYCYYAEKNGWRAEVWEKVLPYRNEQSTLNHVCHLIGVFSSSPKKDV